MYRRQILELSLDRVHVRVTGRRRSRTSRHVLTIGLVWPRPGIAERLAVKPVVLKDGVAEVGALNWTERILFKETVQGPFGLDVAVSEQLTGDDLAKFLKRLGSSLVKLAGSELGDLVSGSLGAGIVSAPFKAFGTVVAGSDRLLARVIGSGTADVSSSPGKKGERQFRLEVPLSAPGTVYRTVRRRTHGEVRVRRRSVLKAGEENGSVVLSARVVG